MNDLESKSIGELLKRFREGRYTQRELALAAGLSDGMIGNVERGTRNLGADNVDAIADALGLEDGEREALHSARKRYAGNRGMDPMERNIHDVVLQSIQSAGLVEAIEMLTEEVRALRRESQERRGPQNGRSARD